MQVNHDDVEIDESDRAYHEGEPLTGELVETAGTGQVVASTAYHNGVADGPSAEWYPSGEPKAAGVIRGGLAVGRHEEWHRNGVPAAQHDFDDEGTLLRRRRWDEWGRVLEDHTVR